MVSSSMQCELFLFASFNSGQGRVVEGENRSSFALRLNWEQIVVSGVVGRGRRRIFRRSGGRDNNVVVVVVVESQGLSASGGGGMSRPRRGEVRKTTSRFWVELSALFPVGWKERILTLPHFGVEADDRDKNEGNVFLFKFDLRCLELGWKAFGFDERQ